MSNDASSPETDIWTAVDDYLDSHLTARDDAASRVLAAQRAAGLADIAVSPTEALLLTVLAKSIGAETVVEFGTLGGYSTLHLARALPGRVTLPPDGPALRKKRRCATALARPKVRPNQGRIS